MKKFKKFTIPNMKRIANHLIFIWRLNYEHSDTEPAFIHIKTYDEGSELTIKFKNKPFMYQIKSSMSAIGEEYIELSEQYIVQQQYISVWTIVFSTSDVVETFDGATGETCGEFHLILNENRCSSLTGLTQPLKFVTDMMSMLQLPVVE